MKANDWRPMVRRYLDKINNLKCGSTIETMTMKTPNNCLSHEQCDWWRSTSTFVYLPCAQLVHSDDLRQVVEQFTSSTSDIKQVTNYVDGSLRIVTVSQLRTHIDIPTALSYKPWLKLLVSITYHTDQVLNRLLRQAVKPCTYDAMGSNSITSAFGRE